MRSRKRQKTSRVWWARRNWLPSRRFDQVVKDWVGRQIQSTRAWIILCRESSRVWETVCAMQVKSHCRKQVEPGDIRIQSRAMPKLVHKKYLLGGREKGGGCDWPFWARQNLETRTGRFTGELCGGGEIKSGELGLPSKNSSVKKSSASRKIVCADSDSFGAEGPGSDLSPLPDPESSNRLGAPRDGQDEFKVVGHLRCQRIHDKPSRNFGKRQFLARAVSST